MEGILTQQTPRQETASRTNTDASNPQGRPPGPAAYTPQFGMQANNQTATGPIQVDPEEIQRGLAATQTTALPQLANLN